MTTAKRYMARTVYYYSKHARLIGLTASIVFVCTFGLFLYSFVSRDETFRFFTLLASSIGGWVSIAFLYTSRIDIDEESGIMTYHNVGKATVDLRKVDRIVRHVSAKGKLRYATFHEVGVKYSDIPIRPVNEDALFAQVRRINPEIEFITYRA